MSKIEFEKFKRDVDWGVIYDFKIIIDGEFRAIWRRDISSVGYFLTDITEHSIYIAEGYRDKDIICPKQALFESMTDELMTARLIPTIAENDERRRLREDNNADAKYLQGLRQRGSLIEAAAWEMYMALESVVAQASTGNIRAVEEAINTFVKPAIEMADGERERARLPEKFTMKLPSGRDVDCKMVYSDNYSVLRNDRALEHHNCQVDSIVIHLAQREMKP